MRDRILRDAARWRVALAAVVCVAALTACSDSLLQVKDPDTARPAQVSGADQLTTQLNSTIGNFQVGFDGDANGDEGIVNMIGLMTDEFNFAETFPTRIVVDQRNMTNNNSTLVNIFFNIERARATAATASDQYNQFDAGNADHSEVLSIEGYSELLMAEMYCGAVPFSTLTPDLSLVNGDPLTTAQMLQIAVATFDSAIDIAVAADDADRENLARVGKARALLDMGGTNIQTADTVVASVPTSFVYQVLHSANTGRETSGIWELIFNEGRWGVADDEGTNGLNFRTAGDPRVVSENIGIGFDGATPVYGPVAYSQRSSPVTLASGIEARLIQAEAALNRGEDANWLADLNELRSGMAGLSPIADPGVDSVRVDTMFTERAFWLFATGHRLGDMRRLTRSTANGGYGRAIESVFPTGTYIHELRPAGVYGSDVSFPIPLEEDNNSAFKGTTCDLTVP